MLTIFIISLLAVSAVSAADNATDDIISTDVSKDVVGIENTTDKVVSIESPADDSAGVKNQDDGLISENDDNVLTANPKTFTDLNNLINGNDDSDVYLESNYTFSMDSDSAFIEGIHINRDVTVHGNGHTIDGDNSAGIFRAEYSDVVFKDIVFVNANSASFGAAMYGGSAVNCTFIGNSAEYGGAMSGVSAVNCTFINNSANSYGGAMHYCFAVNCTFINNSANDWGGAIYCTNAMGCTFVDNSANYGGAINSQYFSGYVVNCTFIHNSASYGGAMWNAESAVNCTFINNSANNGGAIASQSDSYAVNCTFINNSANNGGATYQATISACTFINNTARECGGAMMNGICFNSTFISNHAAKDGGAIYDVAVASSSFGYNSAENGGAMSKCTAKNCTFSYNSATAYGGAVYDAKVSNDSQFNNNNAPNGKDTYEVTWIENSNAKSFTDLKNLIEESGSEVYLNDNYAFDLVSDSILYEGIIVNHTVTVYGNGFTIDGNYLARIFIVGNNDVVFRDIVFVNGRATYEGGAINGYSTVVNCTFINNTAWWSSGAMAGGFAVNCTFINNVAEEWYGGAIQDVSAVNCTFINNTAMWCGGAMADGSAVNCTFIGNSAEYGGAIHESPAVNCTFIYNVAVQCGGAVDSVGGDFVNCVFVSNSAGTWGGAISGADYMNVFNCTFINNSAAGDAGAIWSAGSVVHCTFINNSAGDFGGAVGSFREMPITNSIFIGNIADNGGAASYQVIINNCKFSNNTARECGGAMIQGICINSAFTNNHAAKDGGAIYDVAVVNSSFEYNSAENGGAMSNGTAKNCTFNYNSATAYGGAVYDAKVSTDSQFNNNKAPNGKDTYDVTWIENSNAKSFTDLKNLINQSGSDVYLNDNYSFDLFSEYELTEGIPIYSEVTIHGNGFTIDGNNLARIFSVKTLNWDNVVFKDIVFVNARFAGEGGAIEGFCDAMNCTFINNFAVIAGAMFMGSAVNCTFINNYGGALYGGSAVNCTFVGNSAEYGGAIRDSGSIVNCTFVGNSAEFGGAMSGGSAVNCTFIDNKATLWGGAMESGSAVNCTFINNTAETYGGATFCCEVINCIFKGNTAGIVGDDFYPVGFVLVVHDFISTYKSGDKLLIYLMDDDVSIMDEEIIIKIYKNDSIIGTYHCLSGDGWVVDLDIGNYAALISFEGNDNYDPRNATAKITVISPPSSSLTIDDVNTTVGHEVTLVANVNSTEPINGGTVTFFDGDAYIGEAYVYGGVASLTYTPDVADEHIITAVFTSNNYLGSNATAKLLVDSAIVEILADNGVVGDESTFIANVRGLYSTINGGTVTFYLNDWDYLGSVDLVDGVASLNYTPTSAGDYSIRVVFSNSVSFSDVEASKMFTVNRLESNIVLNDVNGTVGHDVTLTACVFGSNNLTVNEGVVTFFDGGAYIGEAYVYDGVASLTYTPDVAGEHSISAVFASDNYLGSNATAVLLVDSVIPVDNTTDTNITNVTEGNASETNTTKPTPEVVVPPLDEPSTDGSVAISLPSDATGTVILTVNGKEYEFEVKNGVANVKLPDLAEGNYQYTITYSGDGKYSSFTTNGTLNKAAPEVDPEITASNVNVLYTAGSYYTITVKGTDGKPANGITVKITGKISKTLPVTNGVAKFKIDQVPGTYKITISALGKSVTKTITVKHIVTLKTVTVKKSAKKLVLQATLSKVNGKYLKNKKITFKFNGKKYTAKTNKKGVAKLTIKNAKSGKNTYNFAKLKVGKKVTYMATYLKDTVKKTVKVKK